MESKFLREKKKISGSTLERWGKQLRLHLDTAVVTKIGFSEGTMVISAEQYQITLCTACNMVASHSVSVLAGYLLAAEFFFFFLTKRISQCVLNFLQKECGALEILFIF